MPSQPTDLTRRQALTGLVAVGVVGCTATPSSDADPAMCEDRTGPQTAGPFYPGEPPARTDLREDRQGVALFLDLEVVGQGTCAPLVDAEVDVWSADASGAYSGYPDFDTVGQNWLRGQLRTDAEGIVRFTCIVPGSYPGRAVHLHVKVRAEGAEPLTTQVYLPDDLVAEVLTLPAYTDSAAQVRNDDDSIYRPDTLLTATFDGEAVTASGRLVV